MKSLIVLVVIVAAAFAGWTQYQGHREKKLRQALTQVMCETEFLEEARPFLTETRIPNQNVGEMLRFGNALLKEAMRMAQWSKEALTPEQVEGLSSFGKLNKERLGRAAEGAFGDAVTQCPDRMESLEPIQAVALIGATGAMLAKL